MHILRGRAATKASTSVARMAFAFWVNVMVKYQLCVSF